MDGDVESLKKIDAQETLDMSVERKRMAEDREILTTLPKQ
jgi:hypothetical protein